MIFTFWSSEDFWKKINFNSIMKLNDYELMLSDCHVPCIEKSKHEICKLIN